MLEQSEDEGKPEFLSHLEKLRAAGHHLLALLEENFIASCTPEAGERRSDDPER